MVRARFTIRTMLDSKMLTPRARSARGGAEMCEQLRSHARLGPPFGIRRCNTPHTSRVRHEGGLYAALVWNWSNARNARAAFRISKPAWWPQHTSSQVWIISGMMVQLPEQWISPSSSIRRTTRKKRYSWLVCVLRSLERR